MDESRPNDSIFWVEAIKIRPNPYQPRREFDEEKLRDLAESVKQYGILQPLVVTRREVEKEDGGFLVEYELIAGERRLRAAKLAGIREVPVVIRNTEDNDRLKLEIAIIENLQREDLNPVDRALAFRRLADEFMFKHIDIAKRVSKSREYVSNSLRILGLPEIIIDALRGRKITEGHTRPLMMLDDKPEEQITLFNEVLIKRLTVRETELIARKIAHERARKKDGALDPHILKIEEELGERLGTRVHIEPRNQGGRVMIDYLSEDELAQIIGILGGRGESAPPTENHSGESFGGDVSFEDRPRDEKHEEKEEDLYYIKNFTV